MTVVPIELNANKPRVAVRVNGAGPFDFLVDTGSVADLLDAERADELGIVSSGGYDASGAGEATLALSTARGVTLAVDGLTLPAQEIEVAPINRAVGRVEGRRLDGLLGYHFFARFPVELDYGAETLSIGRPPRGTTIPLRLRRRHPFVHVRFMLGERVFEHDFVVDTGFRSGVVLAAPFVREAGLVSHVDNTIEVTTGGGIGGPTIERLARARRVELGPFVLENVVVNFSQARSGTLADGGYGGIVGSELLRRFTVTFDYPSERILLEPNGAYAEPFEFDLSGLFLIAGEDGGIEVSAVVADSPAALAGIQAGDRIVTERPIEQLRRAFHRQLGSEHTLELERGRERFAATFRLNRLI
jgi:hypothetical protein